MYPHHAESIQKLKEYFAGREEVIAIVLDGSIVKGNARPDSDVDAVVVVTEEAYRELAAENRLAEIITGHCTTRAVISISNIRQRKCCRLRRKRGANRRGTLT